MNCAELGAGDEIFSREAALLACDGVVGVGAGLSAHATERSGVSTCSIPHQPPPRHQPHAFSCGFKLEGRAPWWGLMWIFARTHSAPLRCVRAKIHINPHHSTRPIAPLRDSTFAASPQRCLVHAAAYVPNPSTLKRNTSCCAHPPAPTSTPKPGLRRCTPQGTRPRTGAPKIPLCTHRPPVRNRGPTSMPI